MSGREALKICVVLIMIMFAGPAVAVEIKYNDQDRPVEFIGLQIDGSSWNVTVTWTGTMKDTYERNGVYVQPTFYGSPAANDAAIAMQQALLADDYIPNGEQTSYLWVPNAFSGSYYGPGVWLHNAGLTIARVNVNYNNHYGTVGYTRFRFFADGFEGGQTE